MNTRRVKTGERRRQNGWASASEYDVLRGLNGTAVAFKASLQDSAEKRELLYALQHYSLRDGGIQRIARELLEMFPERVGTPTMHRVRCAPGKKLKPDDCRAIYREMFPELAYARSMDFAVADSVGDCTEDILAEANGKQDRPYYLKDAAWFVDECHRRASEHLAGFIEEFCCDPKMEVAASNETGCGYQSRVRMVLEEARAQLDNDPSLAQERPDLATTVSKSREFRRAELPWFADAFGALKEYVGHQVELASTEYVETSISQIVFEAADYVLETGRSALVEGHSGFGKTTALKAWAAMHPGQVRYLTLTAMMDNTVFFKKLAKVCGVANGTGLSAGKIQARVEDFLQRTKLLLIVDEGHLLWPQGQRISTHPKFVNWLNTACYNEGVPFLISATKEFSRRREVVETQTAWSSEQSRRRIRKVFPLPDMPQPGEEQKPWHAAALERMQEDLLAVAGAKLNRLGLGRAAAEFLVGYALSTRGYFQTITDAIEDAQLIAKRAGRNQITARDLQAAVKEWRAPSDAALQRVFTNKPAASRKRARVPVPAEIPTAEPMPGDALTRTSGGLQEPFNGLATGRRETRPAGVPVLTG